MIGCDSKGALHTERADYLDGSMTPIKRWFAESTNPERRAGAPADVIDGADLFIGLSGARVMPAEALARMAPDAMVFAMANPNPEVTPEEAAPYARVIATGRSDYPNQINNVLCFPGIFRGALDVRAREITEEMKMAAARGIAAMRPRRRAARGLHRPVRVQPRRRRQGGRRGGRPGPAPGHRRGDGGRHRLRPAGHGGVPGRPAMRPGGVGARGPVITRRGGPYPVMRITITGATGLIGRRLVRELQARGDEVTALSRDPRRPRRRSAPTPSRLGSR